MNTEALFLFSILVLGLLLYSFLGVSVHKESFEGKTANSSKYIPNMNVTNYDSDSDDDVDSDQKYKTTYDNYNHYSGSFTQLANGKTFYGNNGSTAQVVMQKDGTSGLIFKLSKDSTPIYLKTNPIYSNTNLNKTFTNKSENLKYYGSDGEKAKIITLNGEQYIKIKTENGSHILNSSKPEYKSNTSTYFGSTGVIGENLNNSNKAYEVASPPVASSPSYDYSDSLPKGIPKNQIPPGNEDLYILKSEVVPPVCPACPAAAAVCPRQEPCPPCPACARCPESSFECKKVPNYNSISNNSNNSNQYLPGANYNFAGNQPFSGSNYNSVNNEFLPVPVLSDFSSFGM
jgi:hypothetical protein